MDKTNILVFFANNYDMLNEKQEQMKGCSIHYLFWGEHGEMLQRQVEYNVNEPVGYQRAKDSVAVDLRVNVPVAPAIYEAEFYMTVGSNGKAVRKIKNLRYICNVDFVPKVNPGFVVPNMVSPEEQAAFVGSPAEEKGKK